MHAGSRRHYCEAEYAHSHNSHLRQLNQIYSDLTHDAIIKYDEHYIDVVTDEITNILSQRSLDRASLQATGKIIRLLGNFHKFYYNQRFFDSLSEVILGAHDEEVMIHVLPSFLWTCCKLRYYPQSLLSHAGRYIPDNLRRFTIKDLSMVINAYAALNHPIPQLVSKAEELVLGGRALLLREQILVWSLAWAGMVLQDYPQKLLQVILKDEYIEGVSWFNI